jgi:hypothetical protein
VTRLGWFCRQVWLWYAFHVWMPFLERLMPLPWLGPVWLAAAAALWWMAVPCR